MSTPRQAPTPLCAAIPVVLLLLVSTLLVLSAGTAQATPSGPCGAQESDVDILFAFDVSASMTEELDDVKRASQDLLNNLTEVAPRARIGLASFSDYVGRYTYPGYDAYYGHSWSSGTDYPWRLDQDLTNDTAAIHQAIQGLELLKGGDIPESYGRVLLEATELSSWRSTALPVLVVWGDSYPHDDDLFDRTFGLDPGRDATAGTADDLDLQQTLQGFVDRGGVALMVDANLGTGAADPDDRERTRDAYWYISNATKPNQLGPAPVDGYVRLDKADALEDAVIQFVQNVTPTQAPAVSIHTPQPGHLYDHGLDHVSGPLSDAAVVVGDLPFTASATAECPIEELVFTTTPDVGWRYETTADNATTIPFPAASVPEGTYTLNVTATDTVGQQRWATVPLVVQWADPPLFLGPSPCADTGTVAGTSHQALSVDVAANASLPTRTANLSLVGDPAGLSLASDGPGRPVAGTLTWPDPQVGTFDVTVRATDDHGLTSDCTISLTISNPAPMAAFDHAPASPDEDTVVSFTDNSSDANGMVAAWDWSFGDGTTSGLADPSHRFDPGSRDVCLTVTDDDGATDAVCKTLSISDVAPPTFTDLACDGTPLAATSHQPLERDLQATSTSDQRTVELTLVFGPSGLTLTSDGPANPVNGTLSWPDPVVGSHNLLVRATDSEGESADCPATVEVTNPPPTAAFDLPTDPVEGHALQFTDASGDANGPVVSWSWDLGDGNTSTLQHPSHTYAEAGTYTVCLTVTDEDGDPSDPACSLLDVAQRTIPTFDAPATCSTGTANGTSHQALSIPVKASSADPNRTVTIELVAAPSGVSLGGGAPANPSTGTLSWSDPQVGVHTVQLNAVDDHGEEATCGFDLNVTNPPPVAAFDHAPPSPDEDTLVTFTDNSSDENGAIMAWHWDLGDGTTSTDTDPTHTFAPGTYEVCLTVTDDDGATGATCQTLSVADVPPPTFTDPDGPTCSGGSLSATSHQSFTHPLSANTTASDRTVELALVQGPAGMVLDSNGPANPVDGTISWTDPQLGLHDVVVRATDSQAEQRACLLQLNVTNPPPVANFTFAPPNPDEDTMVGFTDGSTDDNGAVVAWSWTFGDGNTSDEAHPTHTFAPGPFDVCLTVTDDDGATATTCGSITVANIPPPAFDQPDAPTCAAAPRNATSHVALSIDLSATSPAPNRSIALSLMEAPPGLTLSTDGPANPVEGTLSWNDPQVGVHEVVVRATDSAGESSDCQLRLNVTNPAPTANFTLDPASPNEDNLVQFTDHSTDPNGPIASWSWELGDGTTSSAPDPTHTFAPGTFDVCLTVTDQDGLDDTACHGLTVADVPPPVFEPAPLCSGDSAAWTSHVADQLALSASSTGPSRTLTLELRQAPSGVTFTSDGPANPANATLSWSDPLVGVHNVVVRATDSRGESTDCTFVLNVTNLPPEANLTYAPLSPDEDTVVGFTDQSTDENGHIVDRDWDFGDGTTSTRTNPSHTFAPGSHEACLMVTDDDGDPDTGCTLVTVADIPPPAFDPGVCNPPEALVHTSGQPLSVPVNASSDSTRTVTLALVTGPSGLSLSSDGPANPVHGTLSWASPAAGTFDVLVRATDGRGETSDCAITIEVVNPPPVADFLVVTEDPVSHQPVQFQDNSSDENGDVDRWRWTMGDGTERTATDPSHTFAGPATYMVCLTVWDDEGASSAETCKDVGVTNPAPVAAFSFVPASPDEDTLVSFTDDSSDENGQVGSWAWAFGDGATSALADPSHRFDPGVFDVCLTVTDDDGASDTDCQTLTVGDIPPPAFEPDTLCSGDRLTWTSHVANSTTVSASSTGERLVELTLLSAPRGLVLESNGPANPVNGTLSWDDPRVGLFDVVVRATDDQGEYTDCRFELSVTNPGPVAAFSYVPSAPDEDTLVNFTDHSSDENGAIASWAWRFGDGGTSSATNPSHAFGPGTYEVCLTVTDDDGATDLDCTFVTVDDIEPPTFSPETLCSGDRLTWTSHVADQLNLSASSSSDRTVTLALVQGPPGAAFTSDGPANPVDGTLSWSDPQVGLFDVVVRATDSQGESRDCRFQLDVTNPTPQARFIYEPSNPDEDTLVNFTDESSDANGPIVAWTWDFGDGKSKAVTNPSHRFGPGVFDVCLTVTDQDRATSRDCQLVTVTNIPPPSLGPDTLCHDGVMSWTSHMANSTTLQASSSKPNRTVTLALLDGPTGLTLTSDGPANPVTGTLAWDDPQLGSYNVLVRATDSQQETADCPFTLDVTNPAPVADFDHAPPDPTEDTVVQFTDQSSDQNGPITAWAWAFGDGATANTTNATHTFAPGTVDVCLTVTDQDNANDTICPTLTVADIPPPAFSPKTLCEGGIADTWTSQVAGQHTLSASSTSPSRTVTLELVTGPAGMVLGSDGPANPVEGTLSWTDPVTGLHDVLVRATDSQGETTDCPFTIEVVNPAPVADFLVDTAKPVSHQPVQFLDNASDANGQVVAWRWTFGDGNTSAATDPSHTFGAPATFEVCLIVTDDEGRDSAPTCKDVIADNPAPVAAFSYVPASPDEDTLVELTDESTDANGHIVAWDWAFGDGATSTDPDPTYQFAPGTHEVCLTVTDNDGATDTECKSVTVADIPPPSFSPDTLCDGGIADTWISHVADQLPLSANSSGVDRTVTLALISAPAGMTLTSGGPANPVAGTLSWSDPLVGTHSVLVRATDSEGEATDCPFTLDVTNLRPEANFTWTPEAAVLDQPVQFKDLSTDENGQVAAWNWTFSNGQTSVARNPVTTFTSTGAFEACLVVTDDDGDASEPTCQTIHVGNYYGHARMLDVLVAHHNDNLLASQLVDTTRVRENTSLTLLEPLYDSVGLPTLIEAGNSTVTVHDRPLNVSSASSIGQAVLDLPTGQVLEVHDLRTFARASCSGWDAAMSVGRILLDDQVVFPGADAVPEDTVIGIPPNQEIHLNRIVEDPTDVGNGITQIALELQLELSPERMTIQLGLTESVVAMCDLADADPITCQHLCGTRMTGRALGLSLPAELAAFNDTSSRNTTSADTGRVETDGPGRWEAHSPTVLMSGRANASLHSTVVTERGATVAQANVTEYEVHLPSGDTLYLRNVGARAEARCGQPLAASSTIGVIELNGQPLDLDQEVGPNTAVPLAAGTTIFLNRQMTAANNMTVVAVEVVSETVLGDGEGIRIGMAQAGIEGCPDDTAPSELTTTDDPPGIDEPVGSVPRGASADWRLLDQADRWAQARMVEVR